MADSQTRPDIDPNCGWLTNPRNGHREWYQPVTPLRIEWDYLWPRPATEDTPWRTTSGLRSLDHVMGRAT